MKNFKTIIHLTIYFSIIVLFSSSVIADESMPPFQDGTVVGINFGNRPVTGTTRCGGLGVCVMQVLPNNKSSSTSDYDAQGIAYLGKDGRLKIDLDKASISVLRSQEQFNNYSFKLPDDFDLPGELVQNLGIKSSGVKLSSGDYLVHESQEFYTITF